MLGMNEIVVLLVVAGIVFFFGKEKFREWLQVGKDFKKETKELVN